MESKSIWQSCYSNNLSPQATATGLNIYDSAFWIWFGRLNPLETYWLITNPGKAYDVYLNFRQGDVSSQQRFGGAINKDEDGTNQNAYKHAYIAALNNKMWGTTVAYTIMNNHEGGPPPASGTSSLPLASQMDYWNNKLGIDTQNDCGCEGEALRNLIQSKINNGYGRRIVGSGLVSGILNLTTSTNLDND